MIASDKKQPRGQILVLVAIMLIGMLAMLALVLDGGNAYLQRRQAQNAADAAALAGARTYCLTQDSSQAEAVARTYAITNNGATAASVTFPSTNTVNVVADITFNTYFAHLIGRNQMVASAEATSGCFPGVSAHVLPIAWACHTPPIGSPPSEFDCIADVISIEEAKYKALHPPTTLPIHPELYILMDTSDVPTNVSELCQTTTIDGTTQGQLNCDVDGDGDSDLISSGDKGWLNLDGGSPSANELSDFIDGSIPVTINIPSWISGSSGSKVAAIHTAKDYVGSIFTVPVFDDICDDRPYLDGYCDNTENFFTGIIEDRVTSDDTIIPGSGGNYYYHIIGVAGFYVSCVEDNPGKSTFVVAGGIASAHTDCPGNAAAEDIGSIKNNTKTIEGYFITGILPDMVVDLNNPGVNMGTYGLVLLK